MAGLLVFLGPAWGAVSTTLVISEVQVAGATTSVEFIELYNPTNAGIDLNGYRLVRRTTIGTADTNLYAWAVSAIIPPKKFLLIASTSYVGSPAANFTWVGNLIVINQGVALRYGALDTGTIIDSVAWGTATNAFREGGVAASNPAANGSIERKANGTSTSGTMGLGGADEFKGNGEDTNVNGSNFVTRVVSQPQNAASAEEPDVTPPAALTNLAASAGATEGQINVSWTAPGDDGWVGTATSYEVKYSTSAINAGNYASATTYVQSWVPVAGGGAENRVLSGLTGGTTYFLAIETKDEIPNQAALSNSMSAAAQTDVTAPAALTNLAATTGTYETEISLTRKAAGDDAWTGTATSYIVKYSTSAITTPAQFDAASLYPQSWTPLSALSNESRTLTGLTRGTTYYISIKTRDEVPLDSGLSNTSGNSAAAATDILAPAALTNLAAATGPTEGVIHLTWTAPADNGWTGGGGAGFTGR